LESKTPPDIDNNCNKREPFIEAQREIIGADGTFDLLALGTLKYKSAFKMYARANDLDVETQNVITKQIDAYEKAMKYAKEEVEDESEIDITIYDYVDKKYYHLIDGCQEYMGIVDILKSHPCGTLCYDGDAVEDVGVIMVKSESTGKECWVALQESSTIDSFGYLKQDYLIVDTVGLIADIYKEVGIKPLTVNELLRAIDGDKKVWNIYSKGYTMCINQVEQEKSTQKVMRYKPQNISELCSFIAGIRPSFKSMYNIFEARQHFDYGIKAFDNILQDEFRDSSFIFYQEDLMKVLGFAGFPMKDTYTIIKAISKKKVHVIQDAKEKFVDNFKQAILDTHETTDANVAEEMSHKVWKVIENSAAYGFNASHSYCMSIDSVTLAYLKAHYPLQFYKVALQRYTDKGDKNKITRIKKEMNKIGIKLRPIKFGQDNRHFSIDYNEGVINQTMASVKSIQSIAPQELYNIQGRNYNSFIDILRTLEKTSINKTTLEILIGLDYFSDYGNPNQLLQMVNIYNKYANAKVISKDKLTQQEKLIVHQYCTNETPKQFRGEIDNDGLMKALIGEIDVETNPLDYVKFELKYLGCCDRIIEGCNYYGVEEFKLNDYGTPYAKLYRIATGESLTFKVDKKWYNQFTTEYNGKLEQGDIIDITILEKPKRRKIDNEWVEIGTEFVINAFCRK
jgi:DNA polymerase III alpha subunit